MQLSGKLFLSICCYDFFLVVIQGNSNMCEIGLTKVAGVISLLVILSVLAPAVQATRRRPPRDDIQKEREVTEKATTAPAASTSTATTTTRREEILQEAREAAHDPELARSYSSRSHSFQDVTTAAGSSEKEDLDFASSIAAPDGKKTSLFVLDDHDEHNDLVHADDQGRPEQGFVRSRAHADGLDGDIDGEWGYRTRLQYGTFGKKIREKRWDGSHNEQEVREKHRADHRRRQERSRRKLAHQSEEAKERRRQSHRALRDLHRQHEEHLSRRTEEEGEAESKLGE